MRSTNLTNQFLIAMPSLADPNFSQTVTYICAHNEDGAMGIVINRQLDIPLGEVFKQLDLEAENEDIESLPVYLGGPVQADRGFVLHNSDTEWQSSAHISNDIGIATSRDILEAIAHGKGPRESLIALGYAGWGAGQLEEEIKSNAWLSGPADIEIIFRTPCEERWNAAAKLLGVDIDTLSSDIGHA